MPNFALLLSHAPDRYTNIGEDEYGDIMADYFSWVQEKVADGTYQGGHKLNTEKGRYLTSRSGSLEVHDIPSTEIAEVVGGIMIIEAADLDTAVQAIGNHPHFKHNHNVVVLPVDPVSED